VCGDAIVEGDEACDDGAMNGSGSCDTSCRMTTRIMP
jgi:cysteine-rich repeat protein